MKKVDIGEINDTEGLEYLTWSMFDSPGDPGSGFKFMERDAAIVLDKTVKSTRLQPEIIMAYMSPQAANRASLPSQSSHRIGKAVRFKCKNPKTRWKYIKFLIKHGAHNILVSREWIYFDTDKQKTQQFRLWLA